MQRRTKTNIVIFLALGCLMASFAAGSRWLLLDSITSRFMLTELLRARESIQNELDNLDAINAKYSVWDEASSFLQNESQSFVKTHLVDSLFTKLRLNLIVFINSDGKIVFSKFFDYRGKSELQIPDDLLSHLSPGSKLLTNGSINNALKGFINIPTGIMMVSSRPILASQLKGPVQGTLVMARYLDAQEITAITNKTRRSLKVISQNSPNISGNDRNALQSIFNTRQNIHVKVQDGSINGYSLFRDIYGKDAFLLRVDSPRNIFQMGLKTICLFLVLFALVIALLTSGVFVILERLTSSLRVQRESEMRYHTLVDQASEGIILATFDGYFILDANAAFTVLTGTTVQEMRGCSLLDYFDGSKEYLYEEFERTISQSRELKLRNMSGDLMFVEVSGSNISYQGQTVLSFIVHDVTERKNFEEQLMFQANHDPLTGLPNRNLLNDRLTQAIAVSGRENNSLVLMLLDLDHFKVINDTMGHSYGDQLLITVSHRLQELIRPTDTIARIGGDEFVAVMTAIDHSDDVITIANRFLQEISKPYMLQGQEIHISTSIGISQYPEDGDNSESLFKNADTAMYHVKENGRNGVQFFADEMNSKNTKRLKIESELRRAMERNEFSLEYQPQINLVSGHIVGMEALLRWTSSELGVVSPVEFIPIAESTGLIIQMGEWALRTACTQHKVWTDQGLPSLRMAVNLSPRQFGQNDLVEMVRNVLDETGIDAARLDLEVTESLMMHNVEDSIEKMVALKQFGISLSIDDFGTGYSSLNSLQRFPLDILKVDKSFVQEIGNGSKAVIIRAIVAMAHSLGMSIIAEGVETVEQLNFLRNHRCEEVQGYYFSRPLSVDSFTELITSSNNDNTAISKYE